MPKTVKVAIVGSGLAGLVAAHQLAARSREQDTAFDVHIFEKASTLGMDSSSISLPVPGKEQEWRVDVPMRSFQGGYYPQLIALYKSLGVTFRPANFSYSFSLLSPASSSSSHGRRITTAMIYNGASGLAGVSIPSRMKDACFQGKSSSLIPRVLSRLWTLGLFGLVTLQLALCYIRLLFFSIPLLRPHDIATLTFEQWAQQTIPKSTIARWARLDVAWTDFMQFVMVPLFSAICTAPEQEIMDHPMEEFLDYIWLTIGTNHYVVVNGVQDVVARLISSTPKSNIHLASPITALEADPQHPELTSVHYAGPDGSRTITGFHHIIFATQANRAIPLLASYRDTLPAHMVPQRQFVQEQIQCLQNFTYSPTIVINHTDDSLLPDNPADRRDLNLVGMAPLSDVSHSYKSSRCVDSSYTMTTHILPRPKGFTSHLPDVLQTTNPIIPPKEARILSVSRLDRAVVNLASKQALRDIYVEVGRKSWQSATQGHSRLGRLQGRTAPSTSGIWICGSFAYPGIPLLEGCVVSARTVVTQGICDSEGVSW